MRCKAGNESYQVVDVCQPAGPAPCLPLDAMFDTLGNKHASNTAGASRHHKGALALYNAGTVGSLQEKEKACLFVDALRSA